MKDTSIRIRISSGEKKRIVDFASRADRPVSEILRQAAADVIQGEVPGINRRRISANARRSANYLLDVMGKPPIDAAKFRDAALRLRAAASELVQCP